MDETPEQFRERIRSVGFGLRSGQSETRVVMSDDAPMIAGRVTEHWDGRQDATVFAQPVNLTAAAQETS